MADSHEYPLLYKRQVAGTTTMTGGITTTAITGTVEPITTTAAVVTTTVAAPTTTVVLPSTSTGIVVQPSTTFTTSRTTDTTQVTSTRFSNTRSSSNTDRTSSSTQATSTSGSIVLGQSSGDSGSSSSVSKGAIIGAVIGGTILIGIVVKVAIVKQQRNVKGKQQKLQSRLSQISLMPHRGSNRLYLAAAGKGGPDGTKDENSRQPSFTYNSNYPRAYPSEQDDYTNRYSNQGMALAPAADYYSQQQLTSQHPMSRYESYYSTAEEERYANQFSGLDTTTAYQNEEPTDVQYNQGYNQNLRNVYVGSVERSDTGVSGQGQHINGQRMSETSYNQERPEQYMSYQFSGTPVQYFVDSAPSGGGNSSHIQQQRQYTQAQYTQSSPANQHAVYAGTEPYGNVVRSPYNSPHATASRNNR